MARNVPPHTVQGPSRLTQRTRHPGVAGPFSNMTKVMGRAGAVVNP